MGFGPKMPDIDGAVTAIQELLRLLYPEAATDAVLRLFAETSRALLLAKAPLTFQNIDRFWRDVGWRQWILSRTPEPLSGPWDPWAETAVDPNALDTTFGRLLQDRIAASHALDDMTAPPADPGTGAQT